MAYIVRKSGVYHVRWREGGRGSPVLSLRIGAKKKDALARKAEIEVRILEARMGGGSVLPKRILFDEWARRWLDTRTTRPKTQDRDERIVRVHLLPVFGSMPVAAMTSEEIGTVIARLARDKSAWTARRTLAVVRKCLADAKRAGYRKDNPAAEVPTPHMPYVERRLPTLDQFCTLLEAIPSGESRALVLTLALTGCRWGECTALERATDVDFDAERLHIRRQMPANTLAISAPKSAAGRRTVALPWPVKQALLDLPERSPLVFPGERSGYLNHRWWSKAVWRPAVRAAGLDGLRVHDLRHLSASWRIWWGEPITKVAHELGHSSAAFTLRQYAWCMEDGRTLDREATLARIWQAAFPDRPIPRPKSVTAENRSVSTEEVGGQR